MGGTFTLTLKNKTTYEIPFDISADGLKAALNNLNTGYRLSVNGSGTQADPWTVTMEVPTMQPEEIYYQQRDELGRKLYYDLNGNPTIEDSRTIVTVTQSRVCPNTPILMPVYNTKDIVVNQTTIDTTPSAAPGHDVLNILATGSTGPLNSIITGSTLSGLGMAGTITYNSLEALNLTTGSGADSVSVKSISIITSIDTGSGDDTIDVHNDSVKLANIAAGLSVTGGSGSDILTLDNRAANTSFSSTLTASSLTGLAPAVISYDTIEDLNIELGSGSDAMAVVSTSAATLINDAGGDDSFTVGNAAHVLGDLAGTLGINAGTGSDTLLFDDSGNSTGNSGILSELSLSGFSPAALSYAAIEELELCLGSGDDILFVASTMVGTNNINLNDGNDEINIDSVGGSVTPVKNGSLKVFGGIGNDIFRANYDGSGKQTFLNGIHGELSLDGGAGSDLYMVGLSGGGSSIINVNDIAPAGDLGINILNVFGTNLADYFLFRPNVISSIELDLDRQPKVDGGVERINYDARLNGGISVYGRYGDDTFVFDDTSAPMTVYGDAGNDTFQVGQMFKSARDLAAGLAPNDIFDTLQTTQGFLSKGVGEAATLYGGVGDDTFNVYHTAAELFLYGEADDDTFRVRAFVKVDPNDPKKPYTNINGGQGADFIEYAVNAPINIDGGDGFDTLTVVGTEFGDDFVITDKGIFGAGLPIRYAGLDKILVDGMEGNDTFFIASTPENVELEIVGGLGSDNFNVAGGTDGDPITVVGKNLNGHSGLIANYINDALSAGSGYQNLFISDVSAVVADADTAGVVITPLNDVMRVVEGGISYVTYSIVLTRKPEEEVRVTATPTKPREFETKADGKGITLNDSLSGTTLIFDRDNWSDKQYVTVAAPEDSLVEGARPYVIQHSVSQGNDPHDGGEYDKIKVASVAISVVDNDVAGVLITQTNGDTVVAENGAKVTTGSPNDSYSVVLTRQPGDTVQIVLHEVNGQLLLADKLANDPANQVVLTFTKDNWNLAQNVSVKAATDSLVEGSHFAAVTHEITTGTLNNFYNITMDNVRNALADKIRGEVTQDYTTSYPADNTLRVTGSFTVTALFNASSVAGSSALSITNTEASTSHWSSAEITLSDPSGTLAAGDTWQILLNGKAIDYQVEAGNSLEYIAQALSLQIGSRGYKTTITGTTITVQDANGAAFSASFAINNIADTTHVAIGGTRALSQADIALGSSVVLGNIWTIKLNGSEYVYTAGRNGENPYVEAVDVRITDANTPGVLVTQTGGETHVIEPTDYAIIGTGQVTNGGTDGKNFTADFGVSELNETSLHDTIDTAQSLDTGKWNKNADPEIEQSTLLPHMSVVATGDNTADYYKFTVTAEMLAAGGGAVTAVFDIDHGFKFTDQILWGSQLTLFNGSGNEIARGLGYSNPDPNPAGWLSTGSAGSTTWLDDYLKYDVTTAGTYTVKVDNWLWWWSYWQTGYTTGIPQGTDYVLQSSIEGHSVSGFQFTSAPISETSGTTDATATTPGQSNSETGQNVDAPENWSNFYDPTIGNTALGGNINSIVPYVKIIGGGDGNWDVYQFEVTQDMITPPSNSLVNGTPAVGNYYISADILFSGTVSKGDVWTLKLDGVDYDYEITTEAASLSDVVSGISAKLPKHDSTNSATDNYYEVSSKQTNVTGDTLAVTLANGFRFDGLSQLSKAAGTVTRVQNTGGVSLTSGDVQFGGTVASGEVWSLIVNGTKYDSTVTTSSTTVDNIAAELAGKISGAAYIAGSNKISISGAPFTLSFSETGLAPQGTCVISGTPTTASSAATKWAATQIVLAGDPVRHETWVVALNGLEFRSIKAGSSDTRHTLGQDLATKINDDAAGKYTASYDSATDTITVGLQSGNIAPFTAEFAVTPGTDGLIDQYSTFATQQVTLAGTGRLGETWTLRDGATVVATHLVTVDNETLVSIAADLASNANGTATDNYTAAADGATLVVGRIGSTSLSLDLSITAVGASTTADRVNAQYLARLGQYRPDRHIQRGCSRFAEHDCTGSCHRFIRRREHEYRTTIPGCFRRQRHYHTDGWC